MNDDYMESSATSISSEGDGLHRDAAPPERRRSAMEWFWTTVRFCNTFAVTILACCVGWIFLQLQYITFSLNQESDRIDALLTQIQEQQTQQIQKLDEKVENNHSLTLYQMAGTFTLLTCLLTMYHMSTHLRNYHEPVVQRRIVTILWMSPIYSVTAFLALLFPSADGYLAVIRDFYEAYVVYNFLALLILILGRGNRDQVVTVLARHADHLQKPTSCLNSCYHPPPDTSDHAKANAVLYECQVLALQFVFCRPLTSIASFVTTTVMEDKHHDDSSGDEDEWAFFKSPNFYIAMVTNVSVFLAFNGLLKFYHAVREDLAWCQPFSKFMAIKGIVFLTFWQGLLIAIFVSIHEASHDDANNNDSNTKTAQEQALEIQHILICLEMVFFSIAHLCVFPAEEWEPNYRPKEFRAPTMGIKDFAKDVSFIMSSRKRRSQAASYSSTLPQHDEEEGEGMESEYGTSQEQHHHRHKPERYSDDDEDEEEAVVTPETERYDEEIRDDDPLASPTARQRSNKMAYQQVEASTSR